MTCPAATQPNPTCPRANKRAKCGWWHYQGKDAAGNLINPLWESCPHRKESDK